MIFVYSVFNGIPFGNYIAKAKITDYVKQVYGITDGRQMPQYNSKDSYYIANIQQESNKISISYTTDLNGPLEIIVDGKDMLTVEKMQKHTYKPDRIAENTKKLVQELNK